MGITNLFNQKFSKECSNDSFTFTVNQVVCCLSIQLVKIKYLINEVIVLAIILLLKIHLIK